MLEPSTPASAGFFLTSIEFATPQEPMTAENLWQLKFVAEGAQ